MVALDNIIVKKKRRQEDQVNRDQKREDISTTTIFSAESQTMDYTSVKGIRTRIGLQESDFGTFVIKELVDNVLDFIEVNAKKFIESNQNPYVNVIITEEKEKVQAKNSNDRTSKMVTKIKVMNSNAGIDNIFPDYQIHQIFDFSKYYSSKRHRYQISRGALGDAFKAILGIPYAIAINREKKHENNNNNNDWNYPLQINISNKKLIDIKIDNIDKIQRKIKPDIDISIKCTAEEEYLEYNDENKSQSNFTEIVTYIPDTLDYSGIWWLLIKYALVNPHIEFNFEIPDKGNSKNKVYNLRNTQKLKDWKNNQSIYYFSLSEFKELVYSIEENSNNSNAYDNFIYITFREGRTIKKDSIFERLTILDLKSDEKKIESIYKLLRHNMKSKKYQSRSQSLLEVPFDIKQNERREALKERFEQLFTIDDFNYRRIDGYYEEYTDNSNIDSNNNKIEFPFMLEIVILNTPSFVKRLNLVSSINFSPSLWFNSFSDESGEEIFTWENNNKRRTAHSIKNILEDCGYFYNENKHRKSNNFVIINLISPRIDYKSHNKLNIDLKPFADIIAKNLYKIAKSPPRNIKTEEKSYVIDELRHLLRERLDDVVQNPHLKIKDRWTQSTVFYRLRPRLISKEMKVNREYITGKIRTICENEFGRKREDLGIIAADRAQLYFNGESFDVGLDELEELMEKGTDLIVIEKEGVADVLAPFAKNYGIAILNSRGFLTEYATELSRLSEERGCNIAVLSDLDSSGLVIASKLPDSYRIGIDFWTLSYFELNQEDVEEDVIIKDKEKKKESDNHLKKLKHLETIPLSYVDDIDEWQKLVSYVSTKKRIEIDSVLAKVGIEKFWEFIINELKNEFPERNYNRAIDVPKYVLPKEIKDFIVNLENVFTEIGAEEREEIINELTNTKGFFDDIEFKNEEIQEKLGKFISENDKVKRIISEIKKLAI